MLAPRKKLWSTPKEVIDVAIDCLHLTAEDVVYDVGAGDGRFCFRVLERSESKVVAIEIDNERVNTIKLQLESQPNQIMDRCQVIQGNALEIDLSNATAFFLYLVPRGLRLLLPIILNIKRDNIRVVTYMSPFPGVKPIEIRKVGTDIHSEAQWPLYIYNFHNITNKMDEISHQFDKESENDDIIINDNDNNNNQDNALNE